MRYRPDPFFGYGQEQYAQYIDTELNKIANAFVNPDPLWEDLRVSLTTAKPGPTKPPDFIKFKDNGAGSTGVFAYHFSPTAEEEVFFEVQLPHAFVEYNGVIRPHLHWAPITNNSGQKVRWGLEMTAANYGDAFGNTTLVYAEDTCAGTSHQHRIAAFDDVDATPKAISSVIVCRLFRDATHANDNYTSDAAALSFDFHIQLDVPGSEIEYTKRRA